MAHKGYTLNYFIDFFKSIPDHRWTTGTLQREGTVQMCALGHCLANQNAELPDLSSADESNLNAKGEALQNFLEGHAVAINDGDLGFQDLGSTPRGRILRALRNRKRTGSVTGETLE